jgi:(E)-4-hydroxy-3-methylbut-2-enyl-diphosphate synthase
MILNKYSQPIKIGGFAHLHSVLVGENHPVVLQTMYKDTLLAPDLEGAKGEALVSRILGLEALGCKLLRFAVPNLEAADVLGKLASMVSMPLVADIHFDYKIALRCLDYPIAKIRINPGNIGSFDRVEQVVSKAASKAIPIRIGINAGSLPQDLRVLVETKKISQAEALVKTAERELDVFAKLNFNNVLVSMKSSSIKETIEANEILSRQSDVPLHLGITEAGPLISGVVRSAIAFHTLLQKGIGATLRVSLSDTMENEVIAGREILGSLADSRGKKVNGVTIISCPRCGRAGFDTHGFTEKWKDYLYKLDKNITVAIMGCPVNGPGESKHADLGITGAGEKVLIFKHGEIIRTINKDEADAAFKEEVDAWQSEQGL